MLAEPRRKRQWVLNPRINRKLYTELDGNSTFGQKMLEKMGWSKGKGLGKKEDGKVDHVKVNYKNDSKGMGFAGNDGNWLENQSEFDNLLAELGSEYNQNETFRQQPSNLADKSKRSKNRLHYHKMVQGKDLSRRSQEELQCILGKSKKRKTAAVEEENTTTLESEGQMFSSKDNVQSYFEKLKAEKLECKSVLEKPPEEKKIKKKKKKKKIDQSEVTNEVDFQVEPTSDLCLDETFSLDNESKTPKKRKKKKTEEMKIIEDPAEFYEVSKEIEMPSESDKKVDAEMLETKRNKKRKKSKENELCGQNNAAEIRHEETGDLETTDDASKESLNQTEVEFDGEELTSTCNENGQDTLKKKPQKRRKKKRKKAKKYSAPIAESALKSKLEEIITKQIKRVRFHDVVTVFPVAKHDRVRGGALRMLQIIF